MSLNFVTRALTALLLGTMVGVSAVSARTVTSLDTHWKICRLANAVRRPVKPVLGSAAVMALKCPGRGAKWENTQLPDDYIVAGHITHRANVRAGSLPVYPAWYKRTLNIPLSDRGKTIWLNFGGVYRDAIVFINGHFVGQHPSGYTAFRYDISRVVRYGTTNVLTVYVDPRWNEGWWYQGGGIYRHVRLIVTNRLHVAPWGTFVISRVIGAIRHGSAGGTADAMITIKTTVKNAHRSRRSFILKSGIRGAAGKLAGTVSTKEHLGAGATGTFVQQLTLTHAKIWSLGHRNLYHLITVLSVHQSAVDEKRTTFGIRTLRFDPNHGIFLDGRHLEIQGMCNHQDFPGVGIGVPDNLWTWRIKKLKAMGCNAYRTAHNPLPTAFYRACNHLGMLVMDENRHLGDAWTPKSPPGTGYSDLSDLRAMILQQRNNPCVIFWSMCNEENALQGTAEGAQIFAAMQNLAHRLDPTRPVSSAMNGGYTRQGFFSVEDMLGINYHCNLYTRLHRQYPDKMIFGSEDFNCFSARGVLKTSRQTGLCSEYGARLNHPRSWFSDHEPWISWLPVVTHAFVAGDFVWTGFDYRGEPNPFGWPAVTSQTGAMDLCGFRKPCYYYWRAWWRKKPSIYIFPAWTFPDSMIDKPVRVRCYSNCRRVSLILNGRSLGTKTMPKYGYLHWTVPYVPGTLKAVGYDRDRQAAFMSLHTAGPASRLRLMNEFAHLQADGESIAPIAVEVVDAEGRVVPGAANLVHFRVTGAGALAGVGNGDPVSHERNIADQRRAFDGLCMVLVRSARRAGIIHVTAQARGLVSAHLNIRTYRGGGD